MIANLQMKTPGGAVIQWDGVAFNLTFEGAGEAIKEAILRMIQDAFEKSIDASHLAPVDVARLAVLEVLPGSVVEVAEGDPLPGISPKIGVV
jgi:hypothetical protein